MAVRLIFLPLSPQSASFSTGVGAAAGAATVAGAAPLKSKGAGAIAAGATVGGVPSKARGAGSAAGDGESAGAGKLKSPGVGSAAGDGEADGAGAAAPITTGTGAAAGDAEVSGVPSKAKGAGAAGGAATVSGAGRTKAAGAGVALGVAIVAGAGLLKSAATGEADGDGEADGASSGARAPGMGAYEFEDVLDLLTVTPCRLTSLITSSVFNSSDVFSLRTGNVSSWPSFVGAVSGNEADAILYVAATNDNPAGSPTWRDWQRLDTAEFVARAFKFKIILQRFDPSFNIAISDLAVYAEAP